MASCFFFLPRIVGESTRCSFPKDAFSDISGPAESRESIKGSTDASLKPSRSEFPLRVRHATRAWNRARRRISTARQPLNAARDESAPGTLPYTRLTNATHTQYNGESTIRPAAQHSCPCLLAAHGPCWPPRSEGDRTQNRYDTRSRTTTSCKPASTPRCRPEFRTRRRPSTSGCEDPEPHTSPLSPRPRPAMMMRSVAV